MSLAFAIGEWFTVSVYDEDVAVDDLVVRYTAKMPGGVGILYPLTLTLRAPDGREQIELRLSWSQ